MYRRRVKVSHEENYVGPSGCPTVLSLANPYRMKSDDGVQGYGETSSNSACASCNQGLLALQTKE